MKTSKLNEQKIRELYKIGSSEVKTIMEELYGKDFLLQSITDRIKTYKDACIELAVDPLNKSELIKLGFTKQDIAYQKLATIVKALNEDWIPDAYTNVKRWYPWFQFNSSSFTFKNSCFERKCINNGSRLCLKSEELSNYAGKQFLDLWKEFIL